MLEGNIPFLSPTTMAKAAVALQGIGPFILAMAGQSFPSANDDGGCCNDVVAKANKTQKKKKKGKGRALRG